MVDVKRPAQFAMTIQGGMLKALGGNMYTTLGKCLVEFVANGYDGDAKKVSITMPEAEIEKARKEIREAAKRQVEAGTLSQFSSLLLPLPKDIEVTVIDDGHGMLPEEIQEKFLPLNRMRRFDSTTNAETSLLTESGDRYVMGRKGLGKLAGFGAAEKVSIRTKRKGESFATKFELDLNALSNQPNVTEAPIPAAYEDGLPTEEHGTSITLSRLKCDAAKHGLKSIRDTLAEAFHGVLNNGFTLKLNSSPVDPPKVSYEFTYPPKSQRKHDGLARTKVSIPDVGELEFDYAVYFRKRGHNLPAKQRGARIYCNGRLAAGPSLFSLPTGMHNFHSQSYMECVVRADNLDRNEVDLIVTNRTQVREDSEIVSALLEAITDRMSKALTAHSKFRERQAQKEIEKDPVAKSILRVADEAPRKMRVAARRLVKSFAVQYGTDSGEFREVAPLVLNSMNAGEVLLRLSELGTTPGDLSRVASRLRELAEIEENDVLKLYRGRRNGIRGLRQLIDSGAENYLKGPHNEADLHDVLKENPWLIHAHFSRYIVSDQNLEKTVSALAKHLKVDRFSVPQKGGKKDNTRPDLVFAMSDSTALNVITIVELKAPTIALDYNHLTQLKGYMSQCELWLKKHHPGRSTVRGILVGTLPDEDSQAHDCQLLMRELEKQPSGASEEVLGLREMLLRAQEIHQDQIDALKKYEADAPPKKKESAEAKKAARKKRL